MTRPTFALAFALLAGCVDPALQPVSGARIQIEAPHSIARGEDAEITLRFTNDQDQPYRYTASHGCRAVSAWVESGSLPRRGLWPADGSYTCAAVVSENEVAAGDSVVTVVVWNGSRDPAEPTAGLAEPGQYWILADLEGYGKSWDVASRRNVLLH